MAERVALDPDAIRLDGRVALVTGAGAGIGAATALALARFGCDVAICDRDLEGLADTARDLEAIGRRHHAEVLDVRDADATTSWVTGAAAVLGPIDIVVNNAGGGFAAPTAGLSAGGEAALIAQNFSSATGVIRATLDLVADDGASIINITSIEAHRAAPGYGTYAAMKAALASLTQTLALELAPRRIRVNCVAPDVIPTPGVGMLAQSIASRAQRGDAMQPWPEAGHANDVAAAVVWLASPMARFVTGTTIHVDGGTSAALGWRRHLAGGYGL